MTNRKQQNMITKFSSKFSSKTITTLFIGTFGLGLQTANIGCSKSADSFSVLPDTANFSQSSSFQVRKVDILWVVDNSNSMATSQTNLASNFNSFINRFKQSNYDFHMAVTSTDAYLALHYNQPNRSLLKDGKYPVSAGSTHSGVFVMDRDTPNLSQTFVTNASLGVGGNGDERAFLSLKSTLNNAGNVAFRRADAFLAVIIVSDEDDFSHTDYTTCDINGVCTAGYYFTENPNDPKIESVQSFADFLETFAGSTNGIKNYSVNSISPMDTTCANQLNMNDGFSGRKPGLRHMALADLTGGVKASLCGNFSDSLTLISDKILELASTFALTQAPLVASIRVLVNGVEVANDATNGWTYDSVHNSIQFHGSAVPPANSSIQIPYQPATIRN